ncbi:MAG: glycerol-3-phosphate acyltransferase [Dehalococcoidia bacterium]|nr:glycerol-3-phosphate acyltransferase [Dehalococcoidia bacterium]
MTELGAVTAAYLLGAIPFAYIIARARIGVDIRTVDIGNVGAGSVIRAVGLKEGLLTLAGDVGKGGAAILLAGLLDVGLYWSLAVGIVAILGHMFPIYIGFRGGQGVATAIGVFLVLSFGGMMLTLAAMGLMLIANVGKGLSRRLFLITACGAPFLPLFVYVIERSLLMAVYALAVVVLIGVRNLKRLRHPRSITERLLQERDRVG